MMNAHWTIDGKTCPWQGRVDRDRRGEHRERDGGQGRDDWQTPSPGVRDQHAIGQDECDESLERGQPGERERHCRLMLSRPDARQFGEAIQPMVSGLGGEADPFPPAQGQER